MQNLNTLSTKTLEFIENFNPNYLGLYFSLFFHLLILLFAIGLPDFFKQKEIFLPNVIPIEIINISENTSLTNKNNTNENKVNEKKIVKQKKFNSSNNTEMQKIELRQKNEKTIMSENLLEDNKPIIKKENVIQPSIIEKKILENKNKEIVQDKNIETINTKKIKPKLKPKPKEIVKNNTDLVVDKKPKIKKIDKLKDIDTIKKPLQKPEPDFTIASMLKDLRNEKSNNVIKEEILDEEELPNKADKNKENMTLSISEIDLLRQQLSLCWIAPAGAVIEKGMRVRISAKVQQNRKVIPSSVRIVDTNISKNNTFYGPITESAMRTLLNPECTPLKLPVDKFFLWKNLTITFDYSIMKGYS